MPTTERIAQRLLRDICRTAMFSDGAMVPAYEELKDEVALVLDEGEQALIVRGLVDLCLGRCNMDDVEYRFDLSAQALLKVLYQAAGINLIIGSTLKIGDLPFGKADDAEPRSQAGVADPVGRGTPPPAED
jgi:hypothetical protein